MLDYGSTFPASMVRDLLEIELPTIGTKEQFNAAALAELSAIDYVRNVLLGRGMYLSADKDGYRILLPSENQKQVERYIGSADQKLRRAHKLSRNSPQPAQRHDQTAARIFMKRESTKRQH